MRMNFVMRRPGFALLLLSLAGGCTKEEVRVYEVPKEDARKSVAPMAVSSARPKLKWTLPEGWEELPVSSGIRAASFVVRGESDDKTAEVSVVALPGVSAGMTDIVNMWRQQIGLEAVDQSEVANLVERVTIGPGEGELFDMAGSDSAAEGQSANRILVAITRDNDVSWFFKMTGESAFLTEKRPGFIEFLQSVAFEYPAAAPMAGAPPSPGQPGAGAKPHWTVPGGWKEEPPTSMGLAKFSMGDGESGKAEMTVTVLSGAAGGTAANVNRWRGQIGLPPVGEAELGLTPFEEAGAGTVLVDMTGRQRLVGAIVLREGQSWFYKLMGQEAVVEREKGAFVEFVKTVDYSHAH